MTEIVHKTLACGIECGVVPFPHRHIVAFQIRVLAGACDEPEDRLGVARLVAETLDKGTQRRSGRELFDAFDALGASCSSVSGREAITIGCIVLPEHFERAVALHAEMLRTPTFPDDAVEVNVELARQELEALEDDAQDLLAKLFGVPAFGPLLGRHPLGEKETLDRTTRDDLESFWRSYFSAGRMVVTAAGAVTADRVAAVFEEHFNGFGARNKQGRSDTAVAFTPGNVHHDKDLEQVNIGICWPAVDATHDDFPVQQVMLGVLSGGMSARLFTEVREKQGLAYWVSAWQENPRGSGRVFLAASTTAERCARTYTTLLREVDRIAEDLSDDELQRAITGILASRETRGDSTRARCVELANDLFYFGRPVPDAEKIEKIQGVSVADIRRYLADHSRRDLCVLTLGPAKLTQLEHSSGQGGNGR